MIDRNYQKKVDEVKMITSEVECVDAIQTQIEFANRHIMKSAKLKLSMEEA
jgi:hypothetical protein